jgi:superfamily I DNA/RNA helicase
VLVLTFNRTLEGYVTALAESQIEGGDDLDLTVTTFAKWATRLLGERRIIDENEGRSILTPLCAKLTSNTEFLVQEVEYALGRFLPERIGEYVHCRREGRGAVPRCDAVLRQRLIREVIEPYAEWKRRAGRRDWNDLAVALAHARAARPYDVVVADEAQDLSANQLRAIMNHVSAESSVTFILDAVQRIYPRGFTWSEVGIDILPGQSYRLTRNHRNTIQIAQFARALVSGITLDDDGTLPDLRACDRNGPLPLVIKGKYIPQVDYVINNVFPGIDFERESVAFLKPRGGRYFDRLESMLRAAEHEYVTITRNPDWPSGTENIALSTMYSAKGLEFDHVFILGLSQDVTPHGSDPEDSSALQLRKLLAVAATRARTSLIIGFKPGEESQLSRYFEPGTFTEVIL